MSSSLRRRSPRLAIEIPGSLAGRSTRKVTVVDLSVGGCLVRCATLLDQGAILDLSMDLAGQPFVAKVRVSGASLDGESQLEDDGRCLAGLEFLSLPALEETRLRRFVEAERQRRRGADSSSE